MRKALFPGGGASVLLTLIAVLPLSGQQLLPQQVLPLSPVNTRGESVAPFFEGWFENPDGTYTFSFGYFNVNTAEVIEIPVGAQNRVTPAQFDGDQPTIFPPRRVRGLFTITVPGEFALSGERVVWELTSNGRTYSVPARISSPAYELGYFPMAMGSLPPEVRFRPDGPPLSGPMGAVVPPGSRSMGPVGTLSNPWTLSATVGAPVPLEVWVADRAAPDTRAAVRPTVTWSMYRAALGTVQFAGATATASDAAAVSDDGGDGSPIGSGTATVEEGGRAATTVTFTAPGDYLLRVEVANFTAPDSSSGDQCCWTNGYVRVNVLP